ncbi:redoxin domain-containing protein [Christiangramia sabulilitoris]|uniref:Redoxin domain-containing protein n=1 Tax=Christiangramia sabulilitoris TaxID=2583991 RepID=A0A550I5W2_9FLAO|nr:redoxin domain-containing protein [Christiangramia sabulilitoris]TRO66341.1 redoxin domain-containing protein [Christiangramia sabulilitoris]
MKNLKPRQEVPELIVKTTKGLTWNLRDNEPDNFTMLIFYRGIHCPVCKKYLEELNNKIDDFRDKGVNAICISSNTEELAQKTVKEWDVDNLNIGYDFSIEDGRKWDLYVSEAIKDAEPDVFLEPALFLIKPDNTLYSASVQSMPFARPKFDDLLKSISFVLKEDYPARGEA